MSGAKPDCEALVEVDIPTSGNKCAERGTAGKTVVGGLVGCTTGQVASK